jgi:integrase
MATLTDRAVRTAAAVEGERLELRDDKVPGLRLRVSGRTKAWSLLFTLHGKKTRMTLGEYPALGLARARQAAQEARAVAAAGKDPRTARRGEATVGDALVEFEEVVLRHQRTGDRRAQLLRHDLGDWLHRPLSGVTRRDVVLKVDAIAERAPQTAAKFQGAVVRMLNVAAERGLIETNPAAGLRQRIPQLPRTRVLTDDEIRALWALPNVSGACLRWILCTGCRPGEAAGAHRRELDGNLWIIPPEREKGGRGRAVPVSSLALEQAAGRESWLFPSRTKRGRPLRRDGLIVALRSAGLEGFTAHDVRRSARTRLAALGVPTEIAEQIIGHQVGSRIVKTYDRHIPHREMGEAVERLAQHLVFLTGSKNEM